MPLKLGEQTFESRLILGTALYPSLEVLRKSIEASGVQLVTVSLKRQSARTVDPDTGRKFWDLVRATGCRFLPNTAGCRLAGEAVTVAEMSREIFGTDWIKLEVIGDEYNLQPDPFELVRAAEELVKRGFFVLPYCTDDLIVCQRLRDAGCRVLMPWGSPIGSGRGLMNPYALKTLRARIPDLPLIVDAGIGLPSHAAQAMELGFDAVLLNSAVALADDPVGMAEAFALAVRGGRRAWESGAMRPRDLASPSTPLIDTPFWLSPSGEVRS